MRPAWMGNRPGLWPWQHICRLVAAEPLLGDCFRKTGKLEGFSGKTAVALGLAGKAGRPAKKLKK
ncbi:MAG: hypothetical protein A2521_01180 [Deltaproteobacteria bacterium RIFOXYD12_FULL_57_12]|nr:MAG: hypothetical protein A2521_01180 [Deltaproteobacteria bacterium RIFOXYD12_FULL_57_12]